MVRRWFGRSGPVAVRSQREQGRERNSLGISSLRWDQRLDGIVRCDLRNSCFSPQVDGDRVSSSVRLRFDGTTEEPQVTTQLMSGRPNGARLPKQIDLEEDFGG